MCAHEHYCSHHATTACAVLRSQVLYSTATQIKYYASSLGYDTGSTLIHGTEVLVLWFKEDGNHIIDCSKNSEFIFIRTKTLRLAHNAWSFYVLLIFRCKRSALQTTVIYNQVYEAGYGVKLGTKWSSEFTWFLNVIISNPWVQYPNNHS